MKHAIGGIFKNETCNSVRYKGALYQKLFKKSGGVPTVPLGPYIRESCNFEMHFTLNKELEIYQYIEQCQLKIRCFPY